MQKRLVRKLELERFLSQIDPCPFPKSSLEQYTIPVDVAATMLHVAAYTHDNIVEKTVLDLGCGTGRLALGAAFLGAKQVVGVDIDKDAIRLAFKNSLKMKLKGKMQWIIGDVDVVHGSFDVVLQNPPFGIQKRKADRKFLEKALESGKVIYSLHKHPERNRILTKKLMTSKPGVSLIAPSSFLKEFIKRRDGEIRAVYAMVMEIPHMFSFHSKNKHRFIVDLFVIDKG